MRISSSRRETETQLAAFAATPDETGDVGVVILPDVRGLYRFYEGLRCVSPSVESPPSHRLLRPDGWCRQARRRLEYMEQVEQTTPEGYRLTWPPPWRTSAPTELAASSPSASVRRPELWLSAAGGHESRGAVGFYGRPGKGRDGTARSTQRAADFEPRSWPCRQAPTRHHRGRTTLAFE